MCVSGILGSVGISVHSGIYMNHIIIQFCVFITAKLAPLQGRYSTFCATEYEKDVPDFRKLTIKSSSSMNMHSSGHLKM